MLLHKGENCWAGIDRGGVIEAPSESLKKWPMQVQEMGSRVPIRVRTEPHLSLSNRFRPDPNITTRGVLSLDDDIFMTCRDIERGFAAWLAFPQLLTGYHPRLVEGQPLTYR